MWNSPNQDKRLGTKCTFRLNVLTAYNGTWLCIVSKYKIRSKWKVTPTYILWCISRECTRNLIHLQPLLIQLRLSRIKYPQRFVPLMIPSSPYVQSGDGHRMILIGGISILIVIPLQFLYEKYRKITVCPWLRSRICRKLNWVSGFCPT